MFYKENPFELSNKNKCLICFYLTLLLNTGHGKASSSSKNLNKEVFFQYKLCYRDTTLRHTKNVAPKIWNIVKRSQIVQIKHKFNTVRSYC